MPEASSYPSHRKFADDLRRIREERGLTLKALHEETKIPLDLLEELEETGLFGHPMFNRVYLRSLLRAYATFIGIPIRIAHESLDEALLDNYDGRLAVEFLGEEPPEPEATVESEQSTSDEAQAQRPDGEEQAEASTPLLAPGGEPYKEQEGAREKETMRGVRPTALGRRQLWSLDVKKRRSDTHWILMGGAVIVFVAVIWIVLALIDKPVTRETQSLGSSDTTAVDSTIIFARPRMALGNTLDVVVIAAYGKVEHILIRRDDDVRRPYWIEEGSAKVFPALDRIIIEDKLDRIRLLVEGYEYPTDRLDEQGRIVITRAVAQAFLDTLTAAPVVLPSEPEMVRLRIRR
ncbi:MAG: helix-turn-helix domain-containing protein [Rhodothermales bacterium]